MTFKALLSFSWQNNWRNTEDKTPLVTTSFINGTTKTIFFVKRFYVSNALNFLHAIPGSFIVCTYFTMYSQLNCLSFVPIPQVIYMSGSGEPWSKLKNVSSISYTLERVWYSCYYTRPKPRSSITCLSPTKTDKGL